MKFAILIGDGMGDRPVASLGGKTPLQAASIPNIRMAAGAGVTHLIKTVPEDMQPGSDVANLSMMGFNPHAFYRGRAPIEAAGAGIKMSESDTAFRCNLVTVRDGIIEDHSAGDIRTEEAAPVIKLINKKLGNENLQFHAGTGYRHLLIWENGPVQAETTPPHDVLGQPAAQHMPSGKGAEDIMKLMDASREILLNHPVNTRRAAAGLNPATQIWLWGQGQHTELPDYKSTFGLSGGVVSAVDLVRGIGLLAGLQAPRVKGATGFLDTDYAAKVKAATSILEENDFVFVHVEAPDECGHRGSAEMKVAAIEAFDQNIVGPIINYMESLREPYCLVIGTDHPTPVASRRHTREPVPVVVTKGPVGKNSGTGEFHEFINNGKVYGMAFDLINSILKGEMIK